MKFRPPSVPLITVDPYFSVWSSADRLYDRFTEHWTASPNTINGSVFVDGKEYRFMGEGETEVIPQVQLDVSSLVTEYKFSNDVIDLKLTFYTPLFAEDLYLLSRPVSYLSVCYSLHGKNEADVKIRIDVSEEICINKKNEKAVSAEISTAEGLNFAKIGSKEQSILSCSGDDLRIDWGYFYLTASDKSQMSVVNYDDMTFLRCELALEENLDNFILFSYDDVYSINYFGDFIEAYWKKKNKAIETVIAEAYSEASEMLNRCVLYSDKLRVEAEKAGGDKYADILALAYRQVIAAHKLCVDNEGNNVFISKECFSNGCAATVDVTYPSSPFFLLYNTELLKAMLRPIFKFASSDEWQFDFAPHDVGQYPLVLGQVYGKNHEADGRYRDFQMPVEECGNMLIMMANIAFAEKNTEFFDAYEDTLKGWVKYLEEYGMDPEHQLCTDDFAGHLAHNCNLSLKAIMGIAGYSEMLKMKGKCDEAAYWFSVAESMADNWCKTAANDDGSFRLTFDRPDTFSMKYNMVWDKIWNTGLFAPSVYYSEFRSNCKHINAYGMPLDNRKDYTKSDWLVWTACFAPSKEEFEEFVLPLWNCYNVTPSRVPLTDWYDTVTSLVVGFRHRSVQGGLFIELLDGEYLRRG